MHIQGCHKTADPKRLGAVEVYMLFWSYGEVGGGGRVWFATSKAGRQFTWT